MGGMRNEPRSNYNTNNNNSIIAVPLKDLTYLSKSLTFLNQTQRSSIQSSTSQSTIYTDTLHTQASKNKQTSREDDIISSKVQELDVLILKMQRILNNLGDKEKNLKIGKARRKRRDYKSY